MLAVRGRAYSAALLLFETAKKQATKDDTLDQDLFISMIYPSVDSSLSPFHMICCNDTCSFTWTGTTHINQDIFECRTCGLLGTLCCCTECASVCHIGHDCKYVVLYLVFCTNLRFIILIIIIFVNLSLNF